MPSQPWQPDRPDIVQLLLKARVDEYALLASGSNYVYLVTLEDDGAGCGYAVYKPRRGEAPLWDFPDGTLYRREYAAYVVSEALGWGLIPPTVIRADGLEHGPGALQVFIEHDPSQHFFTLRESREHEMKRVALFDWLTNNADRKGGHCILARDGRIWCIDQGLTFHVEDKLRTVIWDYQGTRVPDDLLVDVAAFGDRLRGDASLRSELSALLHPDEVARLEERASLILKSPVYPGPPPYRPYPWPMI